MKKNSIKWIVIGMFMVVAGICYVTGMADVGGGSKTVITASSSQVVKDREVPEAQESQEVQETTKNHITEESITVEATSVVKIFVHVCGEVISPGVYEMEQGSRIYEAVSRAGGYTDRAAVDFLNLARPLEDGMKITIPDRETAKALSVEAEEAGVSLGSFGVAGSGKAGGGVSGQVSGKEDPAAKININTASKEQLMTLSGVGESKAADIIAYREQNGPFRSIEDIMKVSGIKEAGFQKIRENITV